MTPEWNLEDDGYWVATCVLCLTRSAALPTAEDCDPWALSHFESQHPDRVQDATRLRGRGFHPGQRWRRRALRHAPDCALRLNRGECTCGREDNP